MIKVSSSGNFEKTRAFVDRMLRRDPYSGLHRYGRMGVDALRDSTPKETGETAAAWGYEIVRTRNSINIIWYNNHVNDGVNIAVLIQYGHGTGNGGYVQGIDYINPAIRPVFERIAEDVWRQVKA